MIESLKVVKLLRYALEEDIGSGDITTSAVLSGDESGAAQAVAKDDIIVAGIEVFREAFLLLEPNLRFNAAVYDGERVSCGQVIAEVSGSLAHILMAERVALNFLQRMCGIATLTAKYVEMIRGTKARLLDTRKTTPGLRELEKYAVKAGGGCNHRFGLSGGVMIKDNHIEAAGGIIPAVNRALNGIPPGFKIEVEVKNLEEVEEALCAGADIIMLDNMEVETMRKAVARIGGKAVTEASGNVSLATIREIAETGVDFISVGALTHSAPASDISLKVKRAESAAGI